MRDNLPEVPIHLPGVNVRRRRDLIYGARMSGAVRKVPYGHYVISGLVPTGPEKMDKVVAALFEQIERLKNDGPEEAELAKVKTNWRQRNQRSLRENGYWMQRLQASVLDGADPGRMLQAGAGARNRKPSLAPVGLTVQSLPPHAWGKHISPIVVIVCIADH